MKEHETRHTFEQWPIVPKVYTGEVLPPEKEAVGEKERINLIHMEINNVTTTNPIHVTYVTHVEAGEKDMWEHIGEDMVDVAMFLGPPLIRGAKYLSNRYQKRCLPEPRPSEQTGRTDAVHDLACTERRVFDAVATKIGNRSFRATQRYDRPARRGRVRIRAAHRPQ
jgi:hypothetical protein